METQCADPVPVPRRSLLWFHLGSGKGKGKRTTAAPSHAGRIERLWSKR